MKTAYLFPGQGSQYVGMAQDLYERFPEARALCAAADAALGFSLTEKMFGKGDAEEDAATLRQTDLTQPALYVHSMVVAEILTKHSKHPEMVAGHSLGEYSALAAAAAISFADGLRVVRRRGELMARAGDERPGTMAAILNMDDDALVAVCEEVSAEGDGMVQPANFNAPGQVVISGDVAAVERAMIQASERGARRVVPLPVSGAFHSPLMDFARAGLAEELDALDIQVPICPIYLNVTAAPTTNPEEIRTRLLEQLMAPVRWAQTIQQMHADGATRFVELGAGKVLSGLVRRTLGREIEVASVDTADEAQAFLVMET